MVLIRIIGFLGNIQVRSLAVHWTIVVEKSKISTDGMNGKSREGRPLGRLLGASLALGRPLDWIH